AFDELVDGKQHAGLRETLLHDLRRIGNLRSFVRHRLAVDQFDQDGDVPGLDDVENVFSGKVHGSAEDAEADDPAPQCRACLETFVTEAADAVANARAGS